MDEQLTMPPVAGDQDRIGPRRRLAQQVPPGERILLDVRRSRWLLRALWMLVALEIWIPLMLIDGFNPPFERFAQLILAKSAILFAIAVVYRLLTWTQCQGPGAQSPNFRTAQSVTSFFYVWLLTDVLWLSSTLASQFLFDFDPAEPDLYAAVLDYLSWDAASPYDSLNKGKFECWFGVIAFHSSIALALNFIYELAHAQEKLATWLAHRWIAWLVALFAVVMSGAAVNHLAFKPTQWSFPVTAAQGNLASKIAHSRPSAAEKIAWQVAVIGENFVSLVLARAAMRQYLPFPIADRSTSQNHICLQD
jgi:hypothetical protein